MWLFFGAIAVAAALLNVIWTIRGREAKWFRFISLSFTAFTLCAFYGAGAEWVVNEDWSSLMDVAPSMTKLLWVCSAVSVLMNSVSLFKKPER
ncbi:MAG: hypothetical protein HFI26_16510 [Lachnospiraceae bacterium]|mgnify:CR=1 FL=1|jgi:hypothetical protein|nr:hypothetical protein [Lachnospiraceae bacterium]